MIHKSARIGVPDFVKGEGWKRRSRTGLVQAIDLVMRGPSGAFSSMLARE